MDLSKKEQKVVDFIFEWGGFDGGHHKQWVLDQVIRILMEGEYDKWVLDYADGEDGAETYYWDKGVAP